jgi:hypothetical protein
MKCPTCGMKSRKEIEENEHLFEKSVDLKNKFALTFVLVFSFFESRQMSTYVFLISVIFYFILISKANYSVSTISDKRILVAVNVCAIITSFAFSYALASYMIDPHGLGYSVDPLYSWLGIFGLGSIMSKLLVFSKKTLKDFGKLFNFYYN